MTGRIERTGRRASVPRANARRNITADVQACQTKFDDSAGRVEGQDSGRGGRYAAGLESCPTLAGPAGNCLLVLRVFPIFAADLDPAACPISLELVWGAAFGGGSEGRRSRDSSKGKGRKNANKAAEARVLLFAAGFFLTRFLTILRGWRIILGAVPIQAFDLRPLVSYPGSRRR
jgi:hypothetical protein